MLRLLGLALGASAAAGTGAGDHEAPVAQDRAARAAAKFADADPRTVARRLHSLLPRVNGNDDTAAHADALARIDDTLSSTAAAPIWAQSTHAERTQQLQLNLGERGKQYRAKRRAHRRRRMQGKWQNDDPADKDSAVSERLNAASPTCTDPLATNTGAEGACTYGCQGLQQEYFPGEESRCFLYDGDTGTWPEAGGQGEELLAMRKQVPGPVLPLYICVCIGKLTLDCTVSGDGDVRQSGGRNEPARRRSGIHGRRWARLHQHHCRQLDL